MPRPRLPRRVSFEPKCNYFKPVGVPLRVLQEINLTREELEAIRLIDLEKESQKKTAKKMKISQPTLSRLLTSARNKISDSLINGKAIKIHGGNFTMTTKSKKPRRGMGRGAGQGRGRGRMGGFGAGPRGQCVCRKCGHKEPQVRGQPCMNKKCPKCNTPMTRE